MSKDISKLELGADRRLRDVRERSGPRLGFRGRARPRARAGTSTNCPMVIIPMTDGDIELESALTGQIEHGRRARSVQPIWREPGEVHDLRNVGTGSYRNILD